jgi:glycosyltransferase involved in cell wall biosynthesis
MACGRPVITTDAPGCRETVIQDDNGFLVPVKNVDAIYQKMKWFINHPDAVYSMGNRGRQLVEEKFDVNKVNNVICKSMQI